MSLPDKLPPWDYIKHKTFEREYNPDLRMVFMFRLSQNIQVDVHTDKLLKNLKHVFSKVVVQDNPIENSLDFYVPYAELLKYTGKYGHKTLEIPTHDYNCTYRVPVYPPSQDNSPPKQSPTHSASSSSTSEPRRNRNVLLLP